MRFHVSSLNTVTLQLLISLHPNTLHFPHFPSSLPPSIHLPISQSLGGTGESRKSSERKARSGAYILKNHLPSQGLYISQSPTAGLLSGLPSFPFPPNLPLRLPQIVVVMGG